MEEDSTLLNWQADPMLDIDTTLKELININCLFIHLWKIIKNAQKIHKDISLKDLGTEYHSIHGGPHQPGQAGPGENDSLAFYTGSEYRYIVGYDGSGWFKTSKTINSLYTAKIGGKYKKWFTKGGSSPIYLAPNTKVCSTSYWFVVQKSVISTGLIYPNYDASSDIEYGCSCPNAF